MSDSVQFQALSAIRAVINPITGLWPVEWDNRAVRAGSEAQPSTGSHRIQEIYLGGRQRDAAVGIAPRWTQYTEQVKYILMATTDDGVKLTQNMADTISRAVRGTLLTLADVTTPVVVTAVDLSAPVQDGPWIARSLTFTYQYTTT